MIINKIILKNIRSYLEEEISFPLGSTLLSGEIGSGKSTILYGIEFALFGIRRELPGTALLREGKNKGFVILKFQIDGKDVEIKRTLRKVNNAVNQGPGILSINGQRKELTPTELTAQVLNLLGYPADLLAKKKSQIYRYTVYTPQEQMKQILAFDEEVRYDTLRKVFGIDKYKRIKENAEELLRELRAKSRELSVLIENLANIEEKKENYQKIKTELKEKIEQIRGELEKVKEEETKEVEKFNKLESELKELHEIEKKIQILKTEWKNREERIKRDENNLKAAQENLTQLQEKLKGYEELKLPSELSEPEIEAKVREREEREKKYLRRISKLEGRINELRDILSQGICPLCGQSVSYSGAFQEKINQKVKEKKENEEKIKSIKREIERLKLLQNNLREYQQKLREKKNLQERRDELEKQLSLLRSEIKENSQKIKEINLSLETLEEKLPQYQDLDTKRNQVKEHLERIRQQRIETEKKKAALQQEWQDINKELKEIEKQLEKKNQAKKNKEKLNQFENWIREYFIELMSLIENQVMKNIWGNFNLLFQDWFNRLIEDKNLNVRIDERFSPVIEQNNYQITYEYLSGGERTSVALAYRLTLNKMVNSLVENIKTKDLLILDEPTDGFSTAQMESIRAILEELRAKQTILVSHEPKIESFVENVIQIEKKNHHSQIIKK